jgi:hypothetical protein
MQRVDARVQLGQVLPLLQLLEQIALRAFLPVREGGEDSVLLQQPRDVLERLVESTVRRGEGHAGSGYAGRQAHRAVDGCIATIPREGLTRRRPGQGPQPPP